MALLEIVIDVAETIAKTVVPAGIPGPETVPPTVGEYAPPRPVRVLLPLAVFPLKLGRTMPFPKAIATPAAVAVASLEIGIDVEEMTVGAVVPVGIPFPETGSLGERAKAPESPVIILIPQVVLPVTVGNVALPPMSKSPGLLGACRRRDDRRRSRR